MILLEGQERQMRPSYANTNDVAVKSGDALTNSMPMSHPLRRTEGSRKAYLRVSHGDVFLAFPLGKDERRNGFAGIRRQRRGNKRDEEGRDARSSGESTDGVHQRVCKDGSHGGSSNQVAHRLEYNLASGRGVLVLVLVFVVVGLVLQRR